nr:integrase core domain-containing protein [Dankookia rubra]
MSSVSCRVAGGDGTSRSATAGQFWATVDARAPDVGDQLAVWVHHYNWDRPHEALGGLCPIDRVCERIEMTPLWGDVDAAYDKTKERVQVREYAVETALRKLK